MSAALLLGLLFFCFPAGAEEGSFNQRAFDRYRSVIVQNPVEGAVMDRFWEQLKAGGKVAEFQGEMATLASEGNYAGAMLLGHLRRRLGDPAGAMVAYRLATLARPGEKAGWLQLASAQETAGEHGAAADSLRKASRELGISPEDSVALLREAARLFTMAGDSVSAVETWEAIVQLRPEDPAIRLELARQYEIAGRDDEAIEALRAATQEGAPRDRVMAYRELARLEQFHQDNEAAAAALEQALTLMSADHWLHGELVEQLIRLHQIDGTSAQLEKRWKSAVETNPRDTESIRKLLQYYRLELDTASEAEWLGKLLELVPSREDFRARYAEVLWELGRLEESTAQLQQLVEQRPGNAEYQFKLAEIDLQQQREKEAVERLERLRKGEQGRRAASARVLEFYQRNRLFEAAEVILRERLDENSWDEFSVATLASFLLQQGQTEEAEALLQEWIDRANNDALKGERMAHSAAIFQDASRMQLALELLESAIELDPEAFDLLIQKTDLLLSMARDDQARDAAQAAYAAASNEAQRAQADDKLLQTYQRRSRSTFANESLMGLTPVNSALTAFIETLRLRAEKDGRAEDWLRLARWQTWTRNRPEAIRALRKAIFDLEPASIPVLRSYAKLLADEGQARYAIEQYEALAERDPAEAVRYRREIARLEGVMNNWPAAVQTLKELVEDQPGSVDALADLARAHQMAGDSQEALATWERAYLLEDRGQSSRDVLQPYVSMLEEAEEHEKVIEVYEREIQTTNDSARQWSLFSAALQYAERNDLVEPMRERYAARLRAEPSNPFLQSATAALLQREGEEGKAFALLESSSLASPDPSRALETLVETAEEAGRLDEAILHQRRLVMLSRQDARTRLRKLAALQEANYDFRDAAATWSRLAARHPRDTEILREAAEFFLRLEDYQSAEPLLKDIARLDPGMLAPQLALGYLQAAQGNLQAAIDTFQVVVERGPQRPRTAPLLPPGGEGDEEQRSQEAMELLNIQRLLSAGSGGEVIEQGGLFQQESALQKLQAQPEDARLEAIRALALLYLDPRFEKERREWLAGWKAAQEQEPTEALWAFYYSGAAKEALALAETRGAGGTGEELPIYVYVQLAIRLGAIQDLPEWIWSQKLPPVLLADVAVTALMQQLIVSPGELDLDWIDRLLPPDRTHATNRFQAAAVCAARGRYDLAVAIADGLWDSKRQEVVDSLQELAEWQLRLGRFEPFERMIAEVLKSTVGSFRAGRGFALRAGYQLQPQEDRAVWSIERKEEAEKAGLLTLALTDVFLAGLNADSEAIREAADFLIDHRLTSPNSGGLTDSGSTQSAPWDLLVEVIETLRQSGLEEPAQILREKALSDRGRIAVASDDSDNPILALAMQSVVETLQGESLERIQFYMASPEFTLLPPSSRFNPGGEWLQQGAGVTAARWHRALAAKLGRSAEHTRQMIVAYRAADEWLELTEALEEFLASVPEQERPSTLQRDVVSSLIESRERLGFYGMALDLLAAEKRLPLTSQITRSRILRKLGRHEEADKLLAGLMERHENQPLVLEEVARNLEAKGETREALDLLLSLEVGDRGLTNHRAALAAGWLGLVGTESEIRRYARRFAREGEYDALIVLLREAAPELRAWLFQVALITATSEETPPGVEMMRLQELLKAAPNTRAFWQVAGRLERLARQQRLPGPFYRVMADETVRRSLTEEWLEALAERASFAGNDPGPILEYLYFVLEQEKWEVARELVDRLTSINWIDPRGATRAAGLLWEKELRDEALALLDHSLAHGAGSSAQVALRYRMATETDDLKKATELREQLELWGVTESVAWLDLALAMEAAGQQREAIAFLQQVLPSAVTDQQQLADALVRLALDDHDFPKAIQYLDRTSRAAAPALLQRLITTSGRYDLLPALARKAKLGPAQIADLELAIFEEAISLDRFEVATQLCELSPVLLVRASMLRAELVQRLAEQPGLTARLQNMAAALPPMWADPAAKRFLAELPRRD